MSERPSRLSPEYAAWADEKIVSLGRRVAELIAALHTARGYVSRLHDQATAPGLREIVKPDLDTIDAVLAKGRAA